MSDRHNHDKIILCCTYRSDGKHDNFCVDSLGYLLSKSVMNDQR